MENDNLERFADYLPSLVIASDNKQIPKRSERYMPKEVGILKPYIVANHKRCIRFLTFDIDAEDSAFRWDSGRVATPTYNIINGESGHAHYLYEIRDTLPKRSLWSAKTQKKVNELVNGYKLAGGGSCHNLSNVGLQKSMFGALENHSQRCSIWLNRDVGIH